MNKTFATVASALVLTMAVSTAAQARDGFYVAVRGGISDYNLNDKKDSSTASAKINLDDVWNVSGALGYKYKYFRVEAEYTYRDDSDKRYPLDANSDMKVSVESDSIMANAYFDLMPNYWVSPYVMGGIGITRLEMSHKNSEIGYGKTWDEDNFTWQVGGGLSLRLNRCLNFDAGYRYVDMKEIDNAEVTAHEWYGGLRYTF